MDQYNGTPGSGEFAQVGLITRQVGIRWFVYAESGVECILGAPDNPSDDKHCYGNYGDLVGLNIFHQFELVKYPADNFWIARVYDATGVPHDVAKIWSTSNRIYKARSDTEEGYYETSDPYITADFRHWHPQYFAGTDWQEWPVSSEDHISEIWVSPSSICPDHYGAIPNLYGDGRVWFAGTGGNVCSWILFPSDSQIYLPVIYKNPTSSPTDCLWSVDNMLTNGDFSMRLNGWRVWTHREHGFLNKNLLDYTHYDPGNSFPAAFLGGQDDGQPQNDLIDQYITQDVHLSDNTRAIAVEYSYCLETEERTMEYEFDKFLVDVQTVLGGSTLLPMKIQYSNLNASNSCLDNSGNWERIEAKIWDMEPYADNNITLVFYSQVDDWLTTTFYFDAVKIKVCTAD